MLVKLLVSLSLLLFLSACGASKYAVPSKATDASIINDEKMAYVIFATEEIGPRAEPIFEYIPQKEEFKLVAILGSFQKFIYKVKPGIHYFYSMGGETHDFLKVEAEAGKKYYVHIETVFWSFHMTTPLVFAATTDKEIIDEIDKETQLIENSQNSIKWYEQRKDNPDFKAAVKERFEDWMEDDMQEKTMPASSGFALK